MKRRQILAAVFLLGGPMLWVSDAHAVGQKPTLNRQKAMGPQGESEQGGDNAQSLIQELKEQNKQIVATIGKLEKALKAMKASSKKPEKSDDAPKPNAPDKSKMADKTSAEKSLERAQLRKDIEALNNKKKQSKGALSKEEESKLKSLQDQLKGLRA